MTQCCRPGLVMVNDGNCRLNSRNALSQYLSEIICKQKRRWMNIVLAGKLLLLCSGWVDLQTIRDEYEIRWRMKRSRRGPKCQVISLALPARWSTSTWCRGERRGFGPWAANGSPAGHGRSGVSSETSHSVETTAGTVRSGNNHPVTLPKQTFGQCTSGKRTSGFWSDWEWVDSGFKGGIKSRLWEERPLPFGDSRLRSSEPNRGSSQLCQDRRRTLGWSRWRWCSSRCGTRGPCMSLLTAWSHRQRYVHRYSSRSVVGGLSSLKPCLWKKISVPKERTKKTRKGTKLLPQYLNNEGKYIGYKFWN